MLSVANRGVMVGLLAWATSAGADIQLPSLIGDNMVLQQGMPARLWGWADPGETVRVSGSWQPAGEAAAATAGPDRHWAVELPTPGAGGPYEITIAGANTITLRSVMIGEVWVCSGQSNMEMPVEKNAWSSGVLQYEEEIRAATIPAIRLFTVKRTLAESPQTDCEGRWTVCSPRTVGGFSATAYFFGRHLYDSLKVPIGLIHASWGGTRAEAWTDRETLAMLGAYEAELRQKYSAPTADNVKRHDEAESERDRKRYRMDADNKGYAKGYADPGFDDTMWRSIQLPRAWESAGREMEIDGVVWFRKTVKLPNGWAKANLELGLGPVADCDTTYFNGRKLGSIGYGTPHHGQTPRTYTVPSAFVAPGRNVIAVRVFDDGGDGGFVGRADQLRLSCGDAVQNLAAGVWRYHVESVLAPNPVQLAHANCPSVLFNGMIAPITPCRIRGVIWYQGESNHTQGKQYATLFPALIANWRNVWDQGEFPFYYVQIAPFDYREPGSAPELREAQRQSLIVPNTGMVVTMDIGNVTDIHPRNKKEVGRRLALWALARTYGQDPLVYSGPLYRSMMLEGGRIRVFFDHVGGGLMAKGELLTHFEIAGDDGRFVNAEAAIDGHTVIVRHPDVKKPVAVRFGWSNTAEPNLFNKEGLPASPFQARERTPAPGNR